MELDIVWDTLEKTIAAMDSGTGDWENNVQTTQAAILMLLDNPPDKIVEKIKGSGLPPRPVVAWILYEAGKIHLAPARQMRALYQYWNQVVAPEEGALTFETNLGRC